MKDEFLATISHELRTPRQANVGYASMLEQGVAYEPAKAIATILRNAMARTRLVDDILDVSRIMGGKLRLAISRVEVAQTVRAAIESTRPAAAARKIEIIETIPLSLGIVSGDADRLRQVVWNLVANAVKFTPTGGTVEIVGGRLGSNVEIQVRDTGKGIPRDHLLAIFERFRQVDGAITRSQGGLGLAIVRYLVEAHGQRAGDERGYRPRFDIRRHAATLGRGGHEAGRRASRLLIVDDDPDARELLVELLQQAGAVVRSAGSAREALELLASAPPEVLVSDIGMPYEEMGIRWYGEFATSRRNAGATCRPSRSPRMHAPKISRLRATQASSSTSSSPCRPTA
jgi:CheY-like chemotaxis protein